MFCCPRNMIKVQSKDTTGSMNCCSKLAACLAPIAACLATGCCCLCCHLNCCKVLWNALLHGPRKNRRGFVKENEKLDYQIGDMPSDRDKQIIILQKEIEKVSNVFDLIYKLSLLWNRGFFFPFWHPLGLSISTTRTIHRAF